MIRKRKKPKFNVLNAGFRKKVKPRWRKPRGTHNKKRMKRAFTGASPSIGYRNARSVRGLRPSGEREVLVSNAAQLEGLKGAAVRIAAAVGMRKRLEIQGRAHTLNLRVVNLRENGKQKKPVTAMPKEGAKPPERRPPQNV